MLRRKVNLDTSQDFWEVKSKSLVDALNRAALLLEVVRRDDVTIEHTRSKKGKHVITLRFGSTTPA
jgi:hypothetical protein